MSSFGPALRSALRSTRFHIQPKMFVRLLELHTHGAVLRQVFAADEIPVLVNARMCSVEKQLSMYE